MDKRLFPPKFNTTCVFCQPQPDYKISSHLKTLNLRQWTETLTTDTTEPVLGSVFTFVCTIENFQIKISFESIQYGCHLGIEGFLFDCNSTTMY
jgi:hypothetical protein